MQFNHNALKVADKAEIEAFVANVFQSYGILIEVDDEYFKKYLIRD